MNDKKKSDFMAYEKGVTLGQFKGKPMLTLSEGLDTFPFHFGVRKAKLILENLEAIKKFVTDNEESS